MTLWAPWLRNHGEHGLASQQSQEIPSPAPVPARPPPGLCRGQSLSFRTCKLESRVLDEGEAPYGDIAYGFLPFSF